MRRNSNWDSLTLWSESKASLCNRDERAQLWHSCEANSVNDDDDDDDDDDVEEEEAGCIGVSVGNNSSAISQKMRQISPCQLSAESWGGHERKRPRPQTMNRQTEEGRARPPRPRPASKSLIPPGPSPHSCPVGQSISLLSLSAFFRPLF